MGVSLLDHRADADFAESCRLGRMLARRIIKEGLPHGTYLNLNVPNVPNVKGMKVCRQADGRWTNEFKRSENAAGEPVFWLAGAFENADPCRQRHVGARQRLRLACSLQDRCDGL
jgi:5'-nucleotidase